MLRDADRQGPRRLPDADRPLLRHRPAAAARTRDGFYGPYALGLSAHSPVYTSFAGGDGQVGLHGTNQPSVLGTDVSHGCIRVANDVITTAR